MDSSRISGQPILEDFGLLTLVALCPLMAKSGSSSPCLATPLSGGKQTFDLNVRFSADYVRFSPRSGRIDTVTVESARDPKRTLRTKPFGIPFGRAHSA